MQVHARSSCLPLRSYSRLFFFFVRIHGDKKKRCGRDSQWQRLYFSPPFSDMKPIALFSATYSGWSLAKSVAAMSEIMREN